MSNVLQYDLATIKQSIATLNGLKLIHSDEAREVYEEMKNDAFDFNYETIESEEAKVLGGLMQISELLFELKTLLPESSQIVPPSIVEGFAHASRKLSPWKGFLARVANEEEFNREKAMMKVVASQVNQQFLHNKLSS